VRIPRNKQNRIVNKEYSRLPYWTDEGYEDVQRQVSQKYVQDTYGAFAESENQLPYLNDSEYDDGYQGLEYQYQNPEYFDPTDLPDVDFTDTVPKGTCYELWVDLFGNSTGAFIPPASQWNKLREYQKKCPLVYMPHICCLQMKISGPASVAPGATVEYSVSGGGHGCAYDIDAKRGEFIGYKYTAPTTPGSDRLSIKPWMSDDQHTICAYKDILIEGGCKGTVHATTPQMQVGASQTLYITGGNEADTYYWSTTTGSLSATEGESVTYTAPATNANCTSNPTITVTCGGSTIGTLTIAVNAVTTDNAYITYTLEDYENCHELMVLNGCCCELWYPDPDAATPVITNCQYTQKLYKCDGSYSSTTPKDFTSTQASFYKTCDDCKNVKAFDGKSINELIALGVKDNRTSGMKAAGCCPAALL